MTNILTYLERSAGRFPDKPVFLDEHTACTYREAQARAQAIGSGIAALCPPRRPVAVFSEKSVRCAVAFLGIVYAGCFYVLLDPKQSPARLAQILDTLEHPLVLTDEDHKQALEAAAICDRHVLIEDLEQTAVSPCLADIRDAMIDTDPLYGIFTSGSTGVPKGVVVSHRSLIDFMEYFTDLFGITDQDVIGNQAPFDFDVSVKDFYATLKTGATMLLIPRRMFSAPTVLLDYLCEHRVTTLIWAVSALCMISGLHGFDYRVPETVNKVLFSGEVMPLAHLAIWQEHLPDALFVNLYGPTEITCNCTYHIIDRRLAPGDVLPIGRPFPNERVLLLDDDGHIVTDKNVPAELCVAGTTLSLGYYNASDQTAAAFIQNPQNHAYPERLYKTGDIAYYNEDGALCYVARRDRQIKHMGHRIELAEVELAMMKAEGVLRACCIFDEEKKRLYGYYEGTTDRAALTKALRVLLPDFMIPRPLIAVASMPLTKNGKIDRAALKEMNG